MSNIDVFWSEEDGKFVATHPDYPSLSWLDLTPDAAYDSLKELINQEKECL